MEIKGSCHYLLPFTQYFIEPGRILQNNSVLKLNWNFNFKISTKLQFFHLRFFTFISPSFFYLHFTFVFLPSFHLHFFTFVFSPSFHFRFLPSFHLHFFTFVFSPSFLIQTFTSLILRIISFVSYHFYLQPSVRSFRVKIRYKMRAS